MGGGNGVIGAARRGLRPRRLVILALSAAALPLLGGCLSLAGTSAAVATTSYFGNGLSQSFQAHPDTVWEAALTTLRSQGYPAPSRLSRVEARNELLVIQTSTHELMPTEVKVVLENATKGFTRVFVKVGLFVSPDSIHRARLVLEGIRVQLGAPGPAALTLAGN